MSEKKKSATTWQPTFSTYVVVAVVAAFAGFLAVYVNFGLTGNGAPSEAVKAPQSTSAPASGTADASGGLRAYAKGQMSTFVPAKSPKDLPDFILKDGSAGDKTMADWKGRVVLLNLWATWCAPCRHEMPSLDRLQAKLGGEDFEVVAASIDKSAADKPKKFLNEIKAESLNFYHDPTAKLGHKLKAYGMPTTLLIDRNGQEIGRLVGPAEWDSEDALALLRAVINGG